MGGKRILIIDDDTIAVEALYKVLVKRGYQVMTACIGEIGLNKIITDLPDLVILDIMMPGMNGIKVCERIKNNPATKDIQVIMVTGQNTEEDFDKAIEPSLEELSTKLRELGTVVKGPSGELSKRMKDWGASVKPVLENMGKSIKEWKNKSLKKNKK